MKNKRIALILFTIVSIFDIVNIWFDLPFRHFTKSLIIPFLLFYFISSSPNIKSYSLMIVALIFAWLGDVFLLFSGQTYFICGLGSFLFMQLIYSVIFMRNFNVKTVKLILTVILLAAFAIVFNKILWPFTLELRIPVLFYSAAITIMAFTGLNRNDNLAGYNHIVLGVLLFVVSDAVLAINMFGEGVKYGGVIVMFTYILAQYLIVEGYSLHLQRIKSESK